MPVSKKLRAQKTQKSLPQKKLKGHFEQKNSVCWSQLEISAKKLIRNFDHLKPILNDFMVINENIKDFFDKFGSKLTYLREMFKIKKNTSRF